MCCPIHNTACVQSEAEKIKTPKKMIAVLLWLVMIIIIMIMVLAVLLVVCCAAGLCWAEHPRRKLIL